VTVVLFDAVTCTLLSGPSVDTESANTAGAAIVKAVELKLKAAINLKARFNIEIPSSHTVINYLTGL
jgi:hypothetical protein